MRDASTIMRDKQCAVRREMDRRGIALKQVQFDSEIPYPTLASYFPQEGSEREPAVIPMSAVYRLAETKALPTDLLSLLLPVGFAIVEVPEDIDHDEVAPLLRQYLNAKDAAHHPDSPGGREIAPCEDAKLRRKVAKLRAVA